MQIFEGDPLNPADLRIQGVYEQAQPSRFMLRAKVPGALLSAEQAASAADLAEEFGNGTVHLTTRMSLEFHGVAEADVEPALERLRAAGLTSRGACGGAVRGVAVSTVAAASHPRARALARRLHDHFTGVPEFEGLPKKFKVGVDAGYRASRHLIQDVGLVLAGEEGPEGLWDAWVGGGLGREPEPGFLLARRVPEARVPPLVAAVVRFYKARAPEKRRLKHVVRELGRDEVARALREALGWSEVPEGPGEPEELGPSPAIAELALARVFGGELPSAGLRSLARLADEFSGGFLCLTPEQDVALYPAVGSRLADLEGALAAAGFGPGPEDPAALRICPGSHECRLGMAPTRDVARALAAGMGPRARRLTWAVSGCPNSCAQPQLAEVGVVCVRLSKDASGCRRPLYDLLRREGRGFGEAVLRRAPLEEVSEAVRALG